MTQVDSFLSQEEFVASRDDAVHGIFLDAWSQFSVSPGLHEAARELLVPHAAVIGDEAATAVQRTLGAVPKKTGRLPGRPDLVALAETTRQLRDLTASRCAELDFHWPVRSHSLFRRLLGPKDEEVFDRSHRPFNIEKQWQQVAKEVGEPRNDTTGLVSRARRTGYGSSMLSMSAEVQYFTEEFTKAPERAGELITKLGLLG